MSIYGPSTAAVRSKYAGGMAERLSLEEAWLRLMETPEGRRTAEECYCDRDVLGACLRFADRFS